MIQAIPIAFVIGLGWKRPLWGGALLLVLACIVFQFMPGTFRGLERPAPFLILVAPLLLSGFLFLAAAWAEKKAV